jgi:hypothetical protein
MEPQVINATEYRNVALSLLNVSKTNPRRTFEDAALKELAESIRAQGVLSPLLVRPLTENGFEIVFGERRYRAAQLAGQDTVPVRIRQMGDAEALEAQLVENLILSRYLAHSGVECSGEIAFCAEFEFGLAVERFGLNPGIEPREIVGSLQQRLWSLRTATPVDLIPDNAQQGSQKQTGSDANGGGTGDSHGAPFTLPLMMSDCGPRSKSQGARPPRQQVHWRFGINPATSLPRAAFLVTNLPYAEQVTLRALHKVASKR